MQLIRNLWYVAAWSNEVTKEKPIGRVIIGQPVVLYRRVDGSVVVLEDRCAHRHAPLSKGRIEGDSLRCMYHGMLFGSDGTCKHIPGATSNPPGTSLRTYPVFEKSSWVWVWMGEESATPWEMIPDAVGLEDPEWIMKAGAMDYEANYQLINDNLCDLSHLDFVHESTLGYASGSIWSSAQPTITSLDNGLLIQRWFIDSVARPTKELVDTWNSYKYLLPGIFLMNSLHFPRGTAASHPLGPPATEPLFSRYEQQAVTPITETRTRYLYATGIRRGSLKKEHMERMFAVVDSAFLEDREMIEAQQQIWNLTPPSKAKAFIPQDKAPSMMRRKILRLLSREQNAKHSESGV